MSKYPINKEYSPLDRFTPPSSRFLIVMSQLVTGSPHLLKRDKELDFSKIKLDGYQGEKFEIYVINKKENRNKVTPCIIFYHGGGFVFDASNSHYYTAEQYAKRCNCKVIFVRYKLSPKYPFPYPQQECYLATKYVFEHTKELNIDINKIGLTGDSAGATLALSSLLIAKEEHQESYNPLFTVLIYPWLDGRGVSESNKKYIDTPMWNDKLSKKVGKYNNPKNIKFPPRYNSIIEDNDLSNMPKTYIEVAEFDALHNDGGLYKDRLEKYGIEVEYHETKGTMHGYDTKYKAKTTQECIEKRIEYINRQFNS